MSAHKFFICTIVLLAVVKSSLSNDEDQHSEVSNTDKNSIKLPGDLSLPSNMIQLVVAAGALVLGVVGVAIILSLVLPLFGVRICNFLGTCESFTTTAYAGPTYDTYNTAGTYNQPLYGNTAFQKRSLEYVGPILKALSTAYDKYALPIIKKKD
ncbi:hypothetical protein L9F63_011457 [Diploptera punctata]|uniref:Uncharacterized protein n=1 Tax=Diploptera punctata TaxID=6984 RepID=A0AAD8AFH2_DIPPU|nr:hypothetical protein L9F63_011457 [Diploptera punctata]